MSESNVQPGWYPAQGDPPGTQRYWDGTQWVGEPHPVGAAQPQAAYEPPPFSGQEGPNADWAPAGYAAGGPVGGFGQASYPEKSQATTALVLACIGFFFCGFLATIGMVLGLQERKAIDGGRRDPKNRTQATAAVVIGGFVTVLMVLVLVLVILGAAAGSA